MKTFEQRFEKDIKKVVPWHKDEKGRKKFWTICWLTYFGIFVLLLGSAALFTLFGVTFDNDIVGPPWVVPNPASIWYLVGGLIIFVIAIGLGIFFAIYFPGIYKESQNIYLASSAYKARKLQCLKSDLTKYNKRQLKWLFKLKYIDKQQYKSTLETKKKLEKKETIK